MNRTETIRSLPTEYTNRFAWDVLPDQSWRNQPCFIIGGGESLKHFDWNQLKGKLTIGINRVYEKLDPTIIFGQDPHFVRWVLMGKYGDEAKKKFMESRAFKVWLLTAIVSLPSYIHILKVWKSYASGRRAFPFSMKDGIGHGCNSGYGALNFAACLGANPIYLLGYDMKGAHWHDGHPEKHGIQDENEKMAMFIENMAYAAQALKEKGITVTNLNPESALPWFPKIAPAFILNREFAPATQNKKEIISDPGPPAGTKLPPLYIKDPYGFGDTIYLRSVVKHLSRIHETIYLRTTMPEIFWDLPNIKFVRPIADRLWTQKEHIEKLDKNPNHKWENQVPPGTKQRTWASYLATWIHKDASENAPLITTNPRGEESTTKYFENEHGIQEFDFALPLKRAWIREARKVLDSLDTKGKKICIVRQPTVRPEWNNTARNPLIAHLQLLVNRYKDEYYFISLAHTKKGLEWFDEEVTGIDKKFHKGEIPLTTIFAILKLSDMVITYPDLFLLAAIAVRAKCFCIFGGCAKPEILIDKNMGLENLGWITPAPFCNCMRMEHKCNKKIPGKRVWRAFEELRDRALYKKKITVGIPPGIGDMHWILEIMESFREKHSIDELTIKLTESRDHGYSTEFLKLLPFVDRVNASLEPLPFRFSIIGGDGIPLQRNVGGADYVIEFNSRLENGIKLKDILPEYELNHNYPIDYPETAKSFAKFTKRGAGGKLYLLYASSVGGNKNWCQGTWGPEYWVELAEKIYAATKCKPVLIGAKWDAPYATEIMKYDKKNRILNLVGKTDLPEALGLLREARAFVSFLSGLVILATRFKLPTVSFWPTKELAPNWPAPQLFQKSWIPPGAEEEGYFIPFNYGENGTTPSGVFKRLEKHL